MQLKLYSVLFVIFFLFWGCRKEVVYDKPYEQSILESTVFSGLPQLQSNDEINILRESSIRTMAFIKEYVDSSKLDSLTYLEFDQSGKLLERTTKEVTTVGCLPQTIRQIFYYDDDRVKIVDNYTFKYAAKSVFEKWMETDTSRLKKFDWEDYRYSNDTIIVESGIAIWKYVKDENGKLVNHNLFIKATKQTAEIDYTFTPTVLLVGIVNTNNETMTETQKEYLVESNKVWIENIYSRIENVYDEKGLLLEKNYYKDDKLVAKTRVHYEYYYNRSNK